MARSSSQSFSEELGFLWVLGPQTGSAMWQQNPGTVPAQLTITQTDLHEFLLVDLGQFVELQRDVMNLTAFPHVTGVLEQL